VGSYGLESSASGLASQAGSREHGIELFGSVKGGELLTR
jgi:hypothetical protein